MRIVFLFLIAIYSYAALPLPVHYDPFVKAEKIIQKTKIAFVPAIKKKKIVLEAIFEDKAFINGRFYRIGERVYGYKLVAIKDNYVVLRSSKGVKVVPFFKRKFLKVRVK